MPYSAIRFWFCLALIAVLLTGCVSELWVERLEISVEEDLSSQLRFIVLERQQDAQAEIAKGETPEVINAQENYVKPCNIATRTYRSHPDAIGFLAIDEFEHRDDLVHALSCVEILSQIVTIRPITIEDGFLYRDYELQIDLMLPEAFREIQIRLPGTITTYDVLNAGNRTIVGSLPRSDTALWRIDSSGMSQGATATSASASQNDHPVSLIAHSHVWKIDLNVTLSLLGFLFGGGVLLRLLQGRKRKSSNAAP
jgi:hypothetical protein